MKILSEFDIEEEIELEGGEELLMDTQFVEKVKNIFNKSIIEKKYQGYSLQEQRTLVGNIIEGLDNGESEKFIFAEHSDVKHLDYFDNFLGEGETAKVREALEKYGLPTDIFRGLGKNVNGPYHPYNNKDVTITQEVQKIAGDSPVIISFEIKYKGKVIYSWPDTVEEDGLIRVNTPKNVKTKSGETYTGFKGRYIMTDKLTNESQIITKQTISTGKTVARDARGRFVKIK